MKYFERFIMVHINNYLSKKLDPLGFAYHHNRSISPTLHTALYQLINKNTYIKLLFIDYRSTFNAIISSKLVTKLREVALHASL